MFSKEIKKILLIFVIFSTTSLHALVDYPDGLHGFHNYMCYQEDDRIPASITNIYMLMWSGGNSNNKGIYVYEGDRFGDQEVQGPFFHENPEILDLDNDGQCELVTFEGFGEYYWACGACWRTFVPFVYHYNSKLNKFDDVTDKYGLELREKRTKEVLKLIQERESENYKGFYNLFPKEIRANWESAGKAAWAEYLQLNPSQNGIDYFFDNTKGKFNYEYLVELEYLMCAENIWEYSYCQTRPLTSNYEDNYLRD